MIIINKTSSTRYSTLSHGDIRAGMKSGEIDAAGLMKAINEVVTRCGGSFCIRLNKKERDLIDKLMQLADQGDSFKVSAAPKPVSPLEAVLRQEIIERSRKIASIRSEREKELSIKRETTYASRKDIDDAKARSMNMKGDVKARKLEKDDGNVSLQDLMGDNKFIEESMKHSKIATAMASEEGWDMEKMNAPKVGASPATDQAPAPAADQAADKPKTKGPRRSRKESK